MMKHVTLLVFILFISCTIGANLLTKVAERKGNSNRWKFHSEAHPLHPVSFKVLLKQRNLDQLEKTFWEVSDPTHANYGKFLQKHEVAAMIAPEVESKNRVINWLVSSGVPTHNMVVHSDFIETTLPVHKASKLFSTSFSVFKSSITGSTRTSISEAAHIPSELANDIHFIAGISELIEDNHFKAVTRKHTESQVKRATTDNPVTPAVLLSYYGITGTATNKTNLQGVGAFGDYYSSGALSAFETEFTLTKVAVTYQGPTCTGGASCEQVESDLDVQYMTAMGNGVNTTFLAHTESQWVLDWAQQLSTMADPPKVNSASYGWSEVQQCGAGTDDCNSLGYTSKQYVARTDTEFQALGVRGLTMLVSSGDDGAIAFFSGSGNCPISLSNYCPAGGCKFTTSACPEITFTLNGAVCPYPMGENSEYSACATVLANANIQTAFDGFVSANPNCNVQLDLDSEGNYHIYSTCACSALTAKTTKSITVAPYTYTSANGVLFDTMYPAASAYVTSVGATQLMWTGNTVTSEATASILTGALITGGGGFSANIPQPSYQTTAVKTYLAGGNLPPTGTFNSSNRGYPDIAFAGHNYVVYIGNSSTNYNNCPCYGTLVDGTSCSSPAAAGMFSLINDKLLNAGLPQLGFLNPLLYQMAASTPAAFHDIVKGGNQCNRAYCCQYGYNATVGWDAATGLGTPVFSQFLSYIMAAKGNAVIAATTSDAGSSTAATVATAATAATASTAATAATAASGAATAASGATTAAAVATAAAGATATTAAAKTTTGAATAAATATATSATPLPSTNSTTDNSVEPSSAGRAGLAGALVLFVFALYM